MEHKYESEAILDLLNAIVISPLKEQKKRISDISRTLGLKSALLEMLEQLLQNLAVFNDNERHVAFNYILVLFQVLAYMKERSAFALLFDFMHVSQETIKKVFYEDFIADFAADQLYWIAGRRWRKLRKIVDNPDIAIDWKIGALNALVYMTKSQEVERQIIVKYLGGLLSQIVESYFPNPLAPFLVVCLHELHSAETIGDIRKAYERFLIDDEIIPIDDILKRLQTPMEEYLAAWKNKKLNPDYMLDILRDIFREEPEEMKQLGNVSAPEAPLRKKLQSGVGRNDPCPCGSQRKYKKCCGLKSAMDNLPAGYLPPISHGLTDDVFLLEEIADEDMSILDRLLHDMQGEKSSAMVEDSLRGIIAKYPDTPLFYHMLDDILLKQDRIKESILMGHAMRWRFPKDLFTLVKCGELHLRRGEYEKVEELFKGKYFLQEFYPEKNVFSIDEFKEFSLFMGLFFAKKGDIDRADCYLGALRSLLADDEDLRQLDLNIENCHQRKYAENGQ